MNQVASRLRLSPTHRLHCAPTRGSGFHWGLAILAFTLAWSTRASAHQMLGDCVQHRISVDVDATNIDIQVELTFTDMRAMAERRRMDADHDWTVSIDEAQQYAGRLEELPANAFGISVDGKKLRVMPLHEPRIELGQNRQIAPAPHIVRLFYFARTPVWLKAGSEISFTDHLWPEAPAILAMAVSGRLGVRLDTTPTDLFSPAAESGAGRLLRARCLAVPAGGVGTFEEAENDSVTSHLPAAPANPSQRALAASPGLPWLATLLLIALAAIVIKRYSPYRQP